MNRRRTSRVTSQNEAPKLQLGIPGVASLELPLSSGPFDRFRRRYLPRWSEQIEAAGAQIIFSVDERDHASMDLYVTLANFGARNVWVEGAHLNWIAVANGGIDELNAVLPRRTEIPRKSLARVLVRLNLGAASIRRLCRSIGKPSCQQSSPGANTTIRGRLEISRGIDRVSMEFVIENATPQLNFNSTVCLES